MQSNEKNESLGRKVDKDSELEYNLNIKVGVLCVDFVKEYNAQVA